jgi:hypothetical protein
MKNTRHHGRAKPLAWIYFTFLSIRHFLCLITLATTLNAQSLTEQDCTIQLQDTGEKILNWTGHVGRTYFIQSSPDLINWSWAPNIEAGKNRPMSYEVDGPTNAGFYRLQYTDLTAPNLEAADFDGDGLSNLAEITQRPRPTGASLNQSLQASSVQTSSALPVQNGTRKISSKSTRATLSASIQTNPLKTDTDDDGLTDKWEEDHQLDPTDDGSNNPNNGPNGDPDGDGLDNLSEIQNNTDPFRTDTDYDYLPDGWEIQHGLVAASSIQIDDTWVYGYDDVNGTYGDPDGDGIQNQYEYVLGFDPQSANTDGIPDATRDRDGDSLPDWWEAQTGSFRWSYQNQRDEFQRKFDWERDDRTEDTDADGLSNFAKYQNNTNPFDPDTDNDYLPDGWEVQNNGKTVVRMDGVKQFATAATLRFAIASAAPTTVQLNPLDPADALLDPDEDGSTNLEEYLNRL